MNSQIDQFLMANVNSASHANIWEALKAFMRGHILSYSAHKTREKRQTLLKLEEEIKSLEQQHSQTNAMDIFNTLTAKRIEYNNLCTSKAEAALARTNYHYYEYGNKTGKLLAWQIKKEETDRIIDSIVTDGGRVLTSPTEINTEFKDFYQNLFRKR